MKQDVNDDGEDDDRNSQWTKFIPFMLRVPQYYYDNNIHNFVLVPQAKVGITHVLYFNTSLQDEFRIRIIKLILQIDKSVDLLSSGA